MVLEEMGTSQDVVSTVVFAVEGALSTVLDRLAK
jgi:hypothetical protein